MNQGRDNQEFFYIEPAYSDDYGTTPEFVVEGKNPFYDVFNRSEKDDYITDLKEELNLVNGYLQEGKARLLEFPKFRVYAAHPVLLVSENVKTILEQFNLPNHRFDLVKMKPKKISTNSKFYVFQLDSDTLTKDIDFDKVQFYYRVEYGVGKHSFTGWEKIDNPISNYQELQHSLDDLRQLHKKEISDFVNHQPDEFILKSNYDIYSYSVHNKVIVSSFLKQELERLLPGQVWFRSAELLHIRYSQENFNKLSSRELNFPIKINPVKYKSSSEDKYFYEKKKRLEQSEVVMPDDLDKDSPFALVERNLNVQFPEKFRKYYKKGVIGNDYTFLPVPSFYPQNDYSDNQPETYKAIIFAENDSGDSLGLLLDKKSDFKLHSQVYEFLHETGEVRKFKQT